MTTPSLCLDGLVVLRYCLNMSNNRMVWMPDMRTGHMGQVTLSILQAEAGQRMTKLRCQK